MDTERRATHDKITNLQTVIQSQTETEAALQKQIAMLMESNAKLCQQMTQTMNASMQVQQMQMDSARQQIKEAQDEDLEKDTKNLEELVGKDQDKESPDDKV